MATSAFGLTMKVVDQFFDRPEVIRRVKRMNARALSKAGAFVRRAARSSIRFTKKAVSEPGQPPRSHTRDKTLTIRNILFAFDGKDSVVVGPIKLNATGNQLIAGTVPSLLEFGGTAGIREKRVGTRWVSVGRRRPRPGQPTRVRRATYQPRPFMAPALAAEAPKFPDLWSGQFGKAA